MATRYNVFDGKEYVSLRRYNNLLGKYNTLDKVASENVKTLDELNAKIIDLEKENKNLKEELRHREEGDYGYDYFDKD